MINNYFDVPTFSRADTLLSIGDDAAIIKIPTGHHLVCNLTQWIEGVDYSKQAPAMETGKQCLLSSLEHFTHRFKTANWMTLSISMTEINDDWLLPFSQGLLATAKRRQIQLIGGDTSRGPEAIRIHLMGTQKDA